MGYGHRHRYWHIVRIVIRVLLTTLRIISLLIAVVIFFIPPFLSTVGQTMCVSMLPSVNQSASKCHTIKSDRHRLTLQVRIGATCSCRFILRAQDTRIFRRQLNRGNSSFPIPFNPHPFRITSISEVLIFRKYAYTLDGYSFELGAHIRRAVRSMYSTRYDAPGPHP